MVLNINFVTDAGKQAVGHLKDDFTYQDFINMINEQFGANTHQHYTLVAKAKDLCAEDEVKFNQRRKLIVNNVNIFVGRRMIGGQNITKIIYQLF
jgi:hypothetical protein